MSLVTERDQDLTIADDLLPACTVRVELGGRHSGSGFFVAPGFIVTCSHVLDPTRLSSAPSSEITVVDSRGTSHLVDRTEKFSKEDDLAILRLRTTHDHPYVLLNTGLFARDELHTFGYPEKQPDGSPTTLEAEGWLGKRKWLKLKDGVVQAGMSGSPILNLRTGAVCGILKRTRDDRQALGGYAIPVTTLLHLEPTLATTNARYHETGSQWLALLTQEQQRLLKASSIAKIALSVPPKLFVVSVGQDDEGWQVTAEVHPGGHVIASLPVDLNTVRQEVARLFRDWAWRGRVKEAEQIQLLGSILFRAVFPREVGTKLRGLLAERDKERILVNLRFEEGTHPELVNLPWEHLYLPDRLGAYLAADERVSFARSLSTTPVEEDPPSARTLSVLTVGVRPRVYDDEAAVDDAGATNRVNAMLEDLQRIGREVPGVELQRIVSPNVEQLREKVRDVQPAVIHYVGFGRFHGGVDELVVGANTADGVEHVGIDVFGACLRESSVRLVVLQLCELPSPTVPANFALLAPDLLELPLPAVIAYQYPVSPPTAAKLNHTLYVGLAQGDPVDKALQDARRKLWMIERSRPFLSPALFVRQPGELRLTVASRDAGSPPQQSVFGGYG